MLHHAAICSPFARRAEHVPHMMAAQFERRARSGPSPQPTSTQPPTCAAASVPNPPCISLAEISATVPPHSCRESAKSRAAFAVAPSSRRISLKMDGYVSTRFRATDSRRKRACGFGHSATPSLQSTTFGVFEAMRRGGACVRVGHGVLGRPRDSVVRSSGVDILLTKGYFYVRPSYGGPRKSLFDARFFASQPTAIYRG
jgi:hypothetical protein